MFLAWACMPNQCAAPRIVGVDDIVIRSMARWPNTPAVYGWLRLDARGNWRLRNPATNAYEPIANDALREFIGRNYASDERGRWYFQNGPQRVFVDLERSPLVYRLNEGRLSDHCGRAAHRLEGLWMDESSNIYALTELGFGSIDDRDLLLMSDGFVDRTGVVLTPEEFSNVICDLSLDAAWRSAYGTCKLDQLHTARIPGRFGFIQRPQQYPDR